MRFFPFLSASLDSFDSPVCYAGRGVMTDCVWLDAVIFECCFFVVFLHGYKLIPCKYKRWHPFDVFELQARLPLVGFALCTMYFVVAWFISMKEEGVELELEWRGSYTLLQALGPLAIGYWTVEIIIVIYSNRSFWCPEYAKFTKNVGNMESHAYRDLMRKFRKEHNAVAQLDDALPYLMQITAVGTALQYRQLGLYAIILVLTAASELFSALATLLALNWLIGNNLRRPNPYASIANFSPTWIVEIARIFAEIILNIVKFVSGPYSFAHLWYVRNNVNNYVCVIFILAGLRETTAYLAVLFSIVIKFIPGWGK